MNVAPLARRPLGCLKASLRQARQQKLLVRSMATEASTSSQQTENVASPPVLVQPGFHKIIDRKTKEIKSAFAVYPQGTAAGTITAKPPPKEPLKLLHEMQIKKMDPTGARTAMFARTREAVKPGDVLMVTHRRGGEPFAGVCLEIRRRGIDTAVLLRNHLGKTGVEMWFKIYNKNVAGIDIVKRRPKRARRARLTYMRQPKHDMGSVEELVFAWKKSRRVFSTTKSGAASASAAGKGGKGGKGSNGKKK